VSTTPTSTTPTVTGQPVARAVTVTVTITVTDLTCGFNNSNDDVNILSQLHSEKNSF